MGHPVLLCLYFSNKIHDHHNGYEGVVEVEEADDDEEYDVPGVDDELDVLHIHLIQLHRRNILPQWKHSRQSSEEPLLSAMKYCNFFWNLG